MSRWRGEVQEERGISGEKTGFFSRNIVLRKKTDDRKAVRCRTDSQSDRQANRQTDKHAQPDREMRIGIEEKRDSEKRLKERPREGASPNNRKLPQEKSKTKIADGDHMVDKRKLQLRPDMY